MDDGEFGRFMSNSDFIDVKSLVSNSGSCDKTTIHFADIKNNTHTHAIDKLTLKYNISDRMTHVLIIVADVR